jgi:hypothetical protein
MMRAAVLAFALLTLLVGPASAGHRHGGLGAVGPITCPFGTAYVNPLGVGDGCQGAPVGGIVIQPNFSSFARQTGQTWAVAHAQPFNVAAEDYGVGPTAVAASFYGQPGNPISDPETTTPAGCSAVNRTGGAFGTPELDCSGASPTLNGFDFTSAGNANGDNIIVRFTQLTTGTCTATNNRFQIGPGTENSNGWWIELNNSGCPSAVITGNEYIGAKFTVGAILNPAFSAILDQRINASMTLEYNGFLDIPGRPLSCGGLTTIIDRYNYYRGMALNSTPSLGIHGETFQCVSGSNGPVTGILNDNQFNTVVWTSATGEMTATFYEGDGSVNGTTFATVINADNTVITNAFQHTGVFGISNGSGAAGTSAVATGGTFYQNDKISCSGCAAGTVALGTGTTITVSPSQFIAPGTAFTASIGGGEGLFLIEYAVTGTFINVQNYIDPSGTGQCAAMENASGTASATYTASMAATTPLATWTLTAKPGGGSVTFDNGRTLYGPPGFTPVQLAPFTTIDPSTGVQQTGQGNPAGTLPQNYMMSGASSAVASSNVWGIYPTIGTITTGGGSNANINLTDGSVITFPVNTVAPPAVFMADPVCHGHF